MEWAQVRALAADGVSQREIAARLGINRRTVARLAAAAEPPRYSRSPAGSMLDPLEPVMRRLLAEWPEIRAPRVTEILREDYGYAGSVDLVKRRLAKLRPSAGAGGAADGLSAGAGAAGRLGGDADASADRRPRAARLRVGLRVAVLGRLDGALQLRHDDRVVLWRAMSGRSRGWVASRASASMTTCARRSRAATASQITWNARFVQLRGHYAFHAHGLHARDAAREGRRRGRGPLPQDGVLAGAAVRVAGASSTTSTPTGATGSRCRAGTPPAGTSSPSGSRTSASSCGRCRRSPSTRPGGARRAFRWTAISSTRPASTARRRRWFISASSCAGIATGSGSSTAAQRVADYERSYRAGIWQPAPRLRPEPPAPAPLIPIAGPEIVPPALSDYAELCA